MADRMKVFASVEGSLRLEGLDAGPQVRELLRRHATGECSDAVLREAERRVLAGESLQDLLVGDGAPRAA